ncbi:hypothetical protein A4X13_0g7431 [Tilletia indica]|uniref:Uncharacterized protein n=1 Tax=Tilletia indica TaxID=43049 RepID=A0A8T8SJX4_9BASI|nr:hypothetical protein A4X13_0g7431 [Tilletia indica]
MPCALYDDVSGERGEQITKRPRLSRSRNLRTAAENTLSCITKTAAPSSGPVNNGSLRDACLVIVEDHTRIRIARTGEAADGPDPDAAKAAEANAALAADVATRMLSLSKAKAVLDTPVQITDIEKVFRFRLACPNVDCRVSNIAPQSMEKHHQHYCCQPVVAKATAKDEDEFVELFLRNSEGDDEDDEDEGEIARKRTMRPS